MTCSQILKFGQYHACIDFDNVQQALHGVAVNGNEVSCWIASEQDKKFSITCYNERRDQNLQAVLTIDGVVCDRQMMFDAFNFPLEPNMMKISSFRTSDSTCRDFVFSNIRVTDEAALGHVSDIGTIKLELWRFFFIGIQPMPVRPNTFLCPDSTLGSQVIHERSKTIGSHRASLGEEYFVPRVIYKTIDGSILDPSPLVTFIFRYRPLELLVANGVVPRPLKHEVDVEQMTLDAIARVEQILQELRDLHKGINRNVKREPTPS
ncbi:hypothetical protein C8J56DRAFT_1125121 [Mycena floridula]|nr:hypothetical protein C8J56DRAFT_1125121 [Mycena floridula]